MSEFFAGLDLG
jgi:hypothetical protein